MHNHLNTPLWNYIKSFYRWCISDFFADCLCIINQSIWFFCSEADCVICCNCVSRAQPEDPFHSWWASFVNKTLPLWCLNVQYNILYSLIWGLATFFSNTTCFKNIDLILITRRPSDWIYRHILIYHALKQPQNHWDQCCGYTVLMHQVMWMNTCWTVEANEEW